MLSHWQRAHSEHNKATMMKINCRVSGLLHLYFEARCDKGPRFFVQKFLVLEGNRMRRPEKERETTRSSKQCEFCNYVRDKSLIIQGCKVSDMQTNMGKLGSILLRQNSQKIY